MVAPLGTGVAQTDEQFEWQQNEVADVMEQA